MGVILDVVCRKKKNHKEHLKRAPYSHQMQRYGITGTFFVCFISFHFMKKLPVQHSVAINHLYTCTAEWCACCGLPHRTTCSARALELVILSPLIALGVFLSRER